MPRVGKFGKGIAVTTKRLATILTGVAAAFAFAVAVESLPHLTGTPPRVDEAAYAEALRGCVAAILGGLLAYLALGFRHNQFSPSTTLAYLAGAAFGAVFFGIVVLEMVIVGYRGDLVPSRAAVGTVLASLVGAILARSARP